MQPMRTCLGCHRRFSKGQLLKFTLQEGIVEPDSFQPFAQNTRVQRGEIGFDIRQLRHPALPATPRPDHRDRVVNSAGLVISRIWQSIDRSSRSCGMPGGW